MPRFTPCAVSMLAASTLAACAVPVLPGGSAPELGRAAIKDTAGRDLGTAIVYRNGEAVDVRASFANMNPGTYAFHIHETGRCEAPGFTSAGKHWNPAARQHGMHNPQGQHAGDMPNLVIGADRSGTVSYRLVGATPGGLIDGDGSAFVIHARPDDMVSDPAGNAGDRIACGVFSAA